MTGKITLHKNNTYYEIYDRKSMYIYVRNLQHLVSDLHFLSLDFLSTSMHIFYKIYSYTLRFYLSLTEYKNPCSNSDVGVL